MVTRLTSFFLALVATLASVPASAATFNLFSPANGILVGNPSTFVTTSADVLDVTALFAGTCDASTFLRGDGECVALSLNAAGSDTQVQFNSSNLLAADAGLTYNSGTDALTVAGSVVVPALSTSGVLAITATDVTVNGDGVCLADGTNCPAGGGDATLGGTQTFTGINTFAGSPTIFESTAALQRWTETDAPADEKIWHWAGAAGNLQLQTRTDAVGVGATALEITRTGTAVTDIQFSPGVSVGGPARNANSLLSLSGISGGVVYNYDTDGTADNRTWRMIGTSESFIIDKCNDAITTCSDNAIQIEGDSTNITDLNLSADTVRVNGVAINGAQYLRKTANTVRTSTTTMTADPHLAFTGLQPSTPYQVDFKYHVRASVTTIGFKFTWDFGGSHAWTPANIICRGTYSTEPSTTGTTIRGVWSLNSVTTSWSTTGFALTAANETWIMEGSCVLNTPASFGAGSGSLTLVWAQNVSTGEQLTLYQNSYMKVQQL